MKDKITEVKHRLAKIERLKTYQMELNEQIEVNASRLKVAADIAKKENKDVEKLQHASLSSILAWFAKDKEERLMKEEQEALRATVYLKQLQEEQLVLQRELEKAIEEINQEDALYEVLTRLLKEEACNSPYGEKAAELYDALEKEQLLEKELQEAISSSYVVTDALKNAIEELQSASSWGIMDLAGGGILTSLAKHSHVDSAQKKIEEIKQSMRRFEKELSDVSNLEIPNIDIDNWLSFSDIFLDHFIFDIMSQSKINDSKHKLDDILSQITALQDQLLDQTNECLTRQIDIKEQITKLALQ